MFKNVKPYPKQIQVLLTFNGFLAEFYKRLRDSELKSCEVYEDLESDYQKYFGHRKYSNWESFRVTRNKNVKK